MEIMIQQTPLYISPVLESESMIDLFAFKQSSIPIEYCEFLQIRTFLLQYSMTGQFRPRPNCFPQLYTHIYMKANF